MDTTYKRWGGKCDYIQRVTKNGELAAVRAHFLHDYNRAKKITCFSNPAFPAEFQFPKAMPWAGPSCTGISTYGITNNARINLGLWEIPANIFDPVQWLPGLERVRTGGPSSSPSTPHRHLPVDGDVLRFANFHDLVKPTLADASVHLEVTRWFPGEPWPMPEYVAPPDHSVRLFKAVDKSGYVGPTGPWWTTPLNLVGTVAEDYINELITLMARPDVPSTSSPDGSVRPPRPRSVVFPREILHCLLEMTIHKAMAYAMVTGNKSPVG